MRVHEIALATGHSSKFVLTTLNNIGYTTTKGKKVRTPSHFVNPPVFVDVVMHRLLLTPKEN